MYFLADVILYLCLCIFAPLLLLVVLCGAFVTDERGEFYE